jgi:hypothetical protein
MASKYAVPAVNDMAGPSRVYAQLSDDGLWYRSPEHRELYPGCASRWASRQSQNRFLLPTSLQWMLPISSGWAQVSDGISNGVVIFEQEQGN